MRLVEKVRHGRWAGGALALALAAGIALGATLATRMRPEQPIPLPAGEWPVQPIARVTPSPTPALPSPTSHPAARPPSAGTLPPLCHFTGTDTGLQVEPATKSGEDLVLFLSASDEHPCHAVVHYTFSVLDPSAPDGAPLLSATGTLDRALASSRLAIPVQSALAVAWTNWCGPPGTYTVQVTTDANFYYPGASAEADSPGCANRSAKPTFAIVDWLNQLDALSARVDGVNIGETVAVVLASPTGVYAVAVDGVLFLGDPGLLGCTPRCEQSLDARLSLLSPTHARLEGNKFAIDLVAAGPVPADARQPSL